MLSNECNLAKKCNIYMIINKCGIIVKTNEFVHMNNAYALKQRAVKSCPVLEQTHFVIH